MKEKVMKDRVKKSPYVEKLVTVKFFYRSVLWSITLLLLLIGANIWIVPLVYKEPEVAVLVFPILIPLIFLFGVCWFLGFELACLAHDARLRRIKRRWLKSGFRLLKEQYQPRVQDIVFSKDCFGQLRVIADNIQDGIIPASCKYQLFIFKKKGDSDD